MKNKILKVTSVVMAIFAIATILGASLASANAFFGEGIRCILTAVAALFAAAAVIAGKIGWEIK